MLKGIGVLFIGISVLIFTVLDLFVLFSVCAAFFIGDTYTPQAVNYFPILGKLIMLLTALLLYILQKDCCQKAQKNVFCVLFCLFAIHCLSCFMPQFSFDSITVFWRSMNIFSEVYWYEAIQKLWPLGLFVLGCLGTCFIVNQEKENERK